MKQLFVLLPCLLLGACVQVSVSDNIVLDETFSEALPTVPSIPDGGVPSFTFSETVSKTVDVSSVISKLNSVGSPAFSVSSSVLSANLPLNFVSHVHVSLQGAGSSDLVVSDVDTSEEGSTLNLPVLAGSGDLLNVLGSGPVMLNVVLTLTTDNGVPVPTGTLSLDYRLGLNASESISKGL